MKLQKIITFVLISLFSIQIASAENTINTISQDALTTLQSTIKNLGEIILKLQEENLKLKEQISTLNNKLGITDKTTNTGTTVSTISTGSQAVTSSGISKPSSVEKYNQIIEKINSTSQIIFKDLNISSGSTIGLFEFIEPSNFFISIDDLNNPSGITAFKKKILYSYDSKLNFNVEGVFDLDYKTEYYVTKYGKNPFAKAIRIRVKNPIYKGKLLDDETITNKNNSSSTSNSTSNTGISSSSTSTTIPSGDVSLESIKTAYTKNKVLDALKLSNEYIKKDPNNLEVLKIRYRSFHILGKYEDALAEVIKLETIMGDKLEKQIACDGKIIAKLAKKTDLNKKYSDMCSAKK